MAITGAILDFDGTLVDTLDAWRGIEDVLAQKADVVVTLEDRALLTTYTLDETANWFHTKFGLGESAAAVRAMIDEYMVDYLTNSVSALPGVKDFLEACKQAGVKMCVVSSSPQLYLQTALRGTGLLPYFSQVISVEDTGHTKREPHIYEHALALLGTDRESTWGFDDSLYALKTMRDAGFPTVGVFDPHERLALSEWSDHADVVVESFKGLEVEDLNG